MMPRRLLVCCCATLVAGLLAGPVAADKAPPPGSADAAPKEAAGGKHDDHHGLPPVYVGHVHTTDAQGNHIEKEVKFDLRNEEQRKTYFDHLVKGELHESKLDKPKDILELKADLGLWSVVVFIILFFVLAKFAWPQILEGLQAREGNIQGALDEAEKTRNEARRLQEELAKQMAGASDKIREMMDEGRKDAARTTEDMIAKARGEIQSERDRLKRELESAKDSALKELWDNSVKLASMISTRAIKKSMDAETHQRLFDDALAELSNQEKMLKG